MRTLNPTHKLSLFLLSALGLIGTSSAQTLNVEIGQSRSVEAFEAKTDAAARLFNRNMGILTRQSRQRMAGANAYNANIPLTFPTTIWLTSNGKRIASEGPSSRIPGITLSFDSSGANAFSSGDQAFLQGVFDKAEPFLNALFGTPSWSGVVKVKNYDATMSDRDVVSGGYFVPNAPGGPEIRFPVYSSQEVSMVNFLHCLLLAYMGDKQYGFDAFKEGLVRAVTMKLSRTSAAIPTGMDSDFIEQILANTYDVGGFYDWCNQRALGGSTFIAPNLRDEFLPDAGSVGGLYLLRYRMAGSAWSKVLVEYPSFAASFNNSFYGNSGIASNVPSLVSLAQTTIDGLGSSHTVEGMSFANWFKRQFILETKDTNGKKLLVEPIPITSNLSGNDFGVFLIQAHYFERDAGGSESLLSTTAYPVAWEGALSSTAQYFESGSESIPIGLGYGSVAPNFASDSTPYRLAVDVPVSDQLARVYLPVGAIATASNPSPKDFFGTIEGANLQFGDTLRLKVSVNGTPISDVPVTQNAFGTTIGSVAYLGSAQVTVSVVRTRSSSDTTLLTRVINKLPGELGLDLKVESEVDYTFPTSLPKGIAFVGFPVDPFASLNSEVLGVNDSTLLAARYDASKAKYILYPDMEPFQIGKGYFIRSNAAQNPFTVSGRVAQNISQSVALKPGWNMIANPLRSTAATSQIQVVPGGANANSYSLEVGNSIGAEFFSFTPGTNDSASGAPETGTFAPASSFEPGKAYFVRVLAPKGVVMLFSPSALSGTSLTRSTTAMSKTVTADGWQLAVDMTYDRKLSARAIIGQSSSASRGYDPKEDSGMPPGIGGFQVIVEGTEAMYRDIRPLGAQEVYSLHLQGLTKGKLHRLNFTTLKGSVKTFSLRDGSGKNLGTIRPGFTYNFVPKQSDQWIQVVIGGK